MWAKDLNDLCDSAPNRQARHASYLKYVQIHINLTPPTVSAAAREQRISYFNLSDYKRFYCYYWFPVG